MKRLRVGAHDGIPVVHTNHEHQRWLGFWVECECGWIGPGCKTEAKAWEAHQLHVNLSDDGRNS